MMLQKTSSRIKQLITHRYQGSHDLENARFTDSKLSLTSLKRISWLSQTPSTDIDDPQSTDSTITARAHYMAQPSTAHTSSSSLCSCACIENLSLNDAPLSRAEPQPSQPDILYLPDESVLNTSVDAKAWRLIFPDPPPRSSSLDAIDQLRTYTSFLEEQPSKPSLDNNHNPADNDKTPEPSLNYIAEIDITDLSDNVERLIRETDDAFRAVGNALADAKSATHGWYDTKACDQLIPSEQPISNRPLKSERFRSSVPVDSTLARLPITMSKAIQSPQPTGRKALVTTRSQGKSILLRQGLRDTLQVRSHTSSPTIHSVGRWSLNDVTVNMVDVVRKKSFRSNADELLDPDDKTGDNHDSAETDRRVSGESCETPWSFETEPFHLEGLSRRIDAINQQLTPLPLSLQPPTLRDGFEFGRRSRAITKPIRPIRPVRPPPPAITTTSAPEADMIFGSFAFPSPPLIPSPKHQAVFQHRSSRQSSASSKSLKLLPTISELSTFEPLPSPSKSLLSTQKDSFNSTRRRDYIALPSTPWTAIMPYYIHGPILLFRSISTSHSMTELGTPTPEAGGDFDWVSFQMAITGAADEEFGVGSAFRGNSIWEEEEGDLDELERWWEGFGFGLGGFETSAREKDEDHAVSLAPKQRPEPLVLRGPAQDIKGGIWRAAEEELLKTWKDEVDSSKIAIPVEHTDFQTPKASPPPVMIASLLNVASPSSMMYQTLIPSPPPEPTPPMKSPYFTVSSQTPNTGTTIVPLVSTPPETTVSPITPPLPGEPPASTTYEPTFSSVAQDAFDSTSAPPISISYSAPTPSPYTIAPALQNTLPPSRPSPPPPLQLNLPPQTTETPDARRPSMAESLPDSPMLDLGMLVSQDGKDVDFVPMGSNLGHDLGDFLKWENNFVGMEH